MFFKRVKKCPPTIPDMTQSSIKLKIHFAGDAGVGKTCLEMRYTSNQFTEEYVPSVFENVYHTAEHNNVAVMAPRGGIEVVSISLWDSPLQDDYNRLRPLSYPGTNVFLLCKPVNNEGTGVCAVTEFWAPELAYHVPRVPIILVGTKSDLRLSVEKEITDSDKISTFDDGVELARKIGAVEYMECSAKTGGGVREVFKRAVEVGYEHWLNKQPKKKTRRCTLI